MTVPGAAYYPVPAEYLSTLGASSVTPLLLYARQNPDGSWSILDFTNPNDLRAYPDSQTQTVQQAWTTFIQNNQYPDNGRIIAVSPTGLTTASIGFTSWNAANTIHSAEHTWASFLNTLSGITWGGGIFLSVMFGWTGVGAIAGGGLMLLGGLSGAAGGALNIADQAQYGDWQWDGAHVMEIGITGLNLIGGLAGGGDLLIEGLEMVPAADGSQTVQIVVQATRPLVIAGRPVEAGASFALSTGLLITDGPKVQQILQRDKGKDLQTTLWDVVTNLGGSGTQMLMGLLPIMPLVGPRLAAVLGFENYGEMTTFLQGIRDGTLDEDTIAAKAQALGTSPERLRSLATTQGWYEDYQNALVAGQDPALLNAAGQPVSFQDYMNQEVPLPSPDGTLPSADAPLVKRYQLNLLQDTLRHLDQLPVSQPLKDLLASDPQVQLAFCRSGGDLSRLEAVFSRWDGSNIEDLYQLLDDSISTEGTGTIATGNTGAQGADIPWDQRTIHVTIDDATRKKLSGFLSRNPRYELSDQQIGSLVGAQDGDTVTVSVLGSNTITITLENPAGKYSATRYIKQMGSGSGATLVMDNVQFIVADAYQGQGIGAHMLYDEVQGAKRLGVTQIDAYASGETNPETGQQMNGSYTWVRLGFDGDIPQNIRDSMPPAFGTPPPEFFSELIDIPGGIEWWRVHSKGVSVKLKFELDDSASAQKSMNTLEEYLHDHPNRGGHK